MADETIHVVPEGDTIEHDTSADLVCVCGPEREFVDGGRYMMVHNALDGREERERPRRWGWPFRR